MKHWTSDKVEGQVTRVPALLEPRNDLFAMASRGLPWAHCKDFQVTSRPHTFWLLLPWDKHTCVSGDMELLQPMRRLWIGSYPMMANLQA